MQEAAKGHGRPSQIKSFILVPETSSETRTSRPEHAPQSHVMRVERYSRQLTTAAVSIFLFWAPYARVACSVMLAVSLRLRTIT